MPAEPPAATFSGDRVAIGDATAIDDSILRRLGRGVFGAEDGAELSGAAGDALELSLAEVAEFGRLDPGLLARHGYLVPRPPLLLRLVVLSVVVMLGLLAVLGAVTAAGVSALAEAIQERRALARVSILDRPMPPPARLLDAEAFATLVVAEAGRRDLLELARARLLAQEGRWAEAAEGYATARAISRTGFSLTEDLAYAEALLASGQARAAGELLRSHDLAEQSREQAQAVLRLLARCPPP